MKAPGCTGALLQEITRLSETPEHPLAPVSVSVAVTVPDSVDGVKVARAGSGFCVHVPPAPLQVGVPLYEPPAEAPVMAIGDVPVQSPLTSEPAAATGAWKTVTVVFADPEHPFESETVYTSW